MSLALCTLSDASIQRVLADPPLVWKVVAPDDPDMYEGARREPTGFFARILGRSRPQAPPVELVLADDEVEESDIDKAWHGIHYLLTRTAWEGEAPLNFIVGGGAQVGDIDIGYGPARAFTSREVQAIAEALEPIDDVFLRQRFDPADMMRLEIYPEIWDRDAAEDDTFGYCLEHFAALKAFVNDAKGRGTGMLVYLT